MRKGEERGIDVQYRELLRVTVLLLTTNTAASFAHRRLGINSSFAEQALLNHWDANPFLALSTGDSEVWFFSRAQFNDLVLEWPGVKSKLATLTFKAQVSRRRSSLTRSPQDLAPMLAAARAKKAKVLRPGSVSLQIWKSLVLVALTYNVLVIPFRIGFRYDAGKYYDSNPSDVEIDLKFDKLEISRIAYDYIGDVILILDVIIRCRFLAYYKDNALIHEPAKIFHRYRRKDRWGTHVIALVPFEVLLFFIDAGSWKMSVVQVRAVTQCYSDCEERKAKKRSSPLEASSQRRSNVTVASLVAGLRPFQDQQDRENPRDRRDPRLFGEDGCQARRKLLPRPLEKRSPGRQAYGLHVLVRALLRVGLFHHSFEEALGGQVWQLGR